eukprot:gene16519-34434_t
MAAGLGFAVDVDRHVRILAPHLVDEIAQVQHHRIEVGTLAELFVVDRQDEGARAALLLGELAHVAVTGHTHHLEAFNLDGLSQRTDAQTRGVFGTEVLVDDDDGETEFHEVLQPQGARPSGERKREVYGQRKTGPRSVRSFAAECGIGQTTASSQGWTRSIHFRGACMSESTLWWLLAGSTVALELFTGTFYLLMLAVGMTAGALAAHAGLGLVGQLIVAAITGSALVVGWYLVKKRRAGDPSVRALRSVNLDVGEILQIDEWNADGTASVKYRGSQWTVIHRPGNPPTPGSYRVAELVGLTPDAGLHLRYPPPTPLQLHRETPAMEIAILLLIVAAIFITRSVKVVPQQNAWVVERLGKYHSALAPGLNFLVPFIDKVAYKH